MDIEMTPKVKRSFELDPKNELAIRNAYNTPQKSYNCGGLALRAYNWITPYNEDEEDEDYDDYDPYTEADRECLMEDWLNDDGYSEEEVASKILVEDVKHLLKRFPFLEEVELEDTKNSDIVIAYRLFVRADKVDDNYIVDDTDFHFKVRYNGFWFEKLGGGRTVMCELIPNDYWEYLDKDLVYDSDIVYFRDKRGMNI